jgi:hypothetical protein
VRRVPSHEQRRAVVEEVDGGALLLEEDPA